MGSSYRNSLNVWLSQLDVKADRVLDIGGSQLTMPKRVKSWDVKEYLIADLPQPHADSPMPKILFDLNYDQWKPQMETFDVVFCLEVMDYVFDPVRAMKSISHFTKEKGTAWITFPTFYPTHNPIEDDALCYKEAGIRKLAEASGLKIEEMIRRRPETNALQQFFSAERLRAAKGYDHAVLGWIVRFEK